MFVLLILTCKKLELRMILFKTSHNFGDKKDDLVQITYFESWLCCCENNPDKRTLKEEEENIQSRDMKRSMDYGEVFKIFTGS